MKLSDYDYGVVNDSLRKVVRHLENCTYTFKSDKHAIEEVIHLTEDILNHLNKLEFIEEE